MKLLYLISLFITIPGALAFAITIPEDYTAKILKFNDTYYAVNSTQNIIYGPDNDIGSVINHIQNMLPSGSLIKIQCANYKLYTQINLTKSDDIEGIGDSYNCVSFTPQNKVSGSYVIWNSRTALSNISINGNFDHQTYFDVETNGPMEIDNFQLTNPNSTGSNAILVGNRTEI
ncbi:MAG: hypothetical protein KGI27_15390, partial [Thaumarchaeota archaeon]|nr:hypothetical protein [Nitrososphaerota archaeon]